MKLFKGMSDKELTRSIALNGIVAALYVVLVYAAFPLSYGMIQFRIAEMLILLCFFRPNLIFGLTLGCFLANIGSTMPLWDMLFGTLATLISCIGIIYAPRLLVAVFIPVVANALVVGAELTLIFGDAPFWVNAGFVALGEFVVLIVGYAIVMGLMRLKKFYPLIGATKHLEVQW